MKVLLDIKDSKVEFVMELLKNFKFVKAEPLSHYKSEVLEDIKESVKAMNLVKEGKLKARPLQELINEL